MPQIPLDKADFILAYTAARDWFTCGGRTCRGPNQIKRASEIGVNELRRLRNAKRLPHGVEDLRQRIEDCLIIVKRRFTEREIDDPLLVKQPLTERYLEWLDNMAHEVFWNRRDGYGIRRRRQIQIQSYYRPAVLDLILGGSLAEIGCIGTYNIEWKEGEYRVWITRCWRELLREGLGNVEGRFVLAAEDAYKVLNHHIVDRAKNDSPGIKRIWIGRWIERGRGYDLKLRLGLIVRLTDEQTFLVEGRFPPFMIQALWKTRVASFERGPLAQWPNIPASIPLPFSRAARLARRKFYEGHKRKMARQRRRRRKTK